MSNVHAFRRRLSDAELLRTEFRVHDPEHLTNLNRDVPDAETHPTIIGYYDETPPSGRKGNPDVPFIRCCHCGLRRHWKGFVVENDRDQVHIIGARKCGREHYGAKFDAAYKAFRTEKKRRTALIRWQNMIALVPGFLRDIALLVDAPGLKVIERKAGEIRRASQAAVQSLVRQAHSGNSLVEVKEYRDFAAEAEREKKFERAIAAFRALPSEERLRVHREGRRPEPDKSPIIRRTEEPLGPLMGAGFLTNEGDVRTTAIALRKTLDAVGRIEAAGTEDVPLADLTRLLREMTERPKAVKDALHELAFVDLFFSSENLSRLERWTSSERHFSLHHHKGALLIDDAKNGRTLVLPPTGHELPTTPAFLYAGYITEEFLPLTADAA